MLSSAGNARQFGNEAWTIGNDPLGWWLCKDSIIIGKRARHEPPEGGDRYRARSGTGKLRETMARRLGSAVGQPEGAEVV